MKRLVLLLALLILIAGGANAVVVGIHTASTAMLGSGSGYYVSGSHIYLWENWTTNGNLFLGNNTGAHWNSLSNELDGRDYLDIYTGLVPGSGSTDTETFGLGDFDVSSNEPLRLAQRPSEFVFEGETSRPPTVPEPATLLLFGIGLAGFALRKRFRK